MKNFNPEEEFEFVTEELAAYVYERDNGRCVICSQNGVEIHHIRYKSSGRGKGRNKANNLVCLCSKHHKQNHDTKSLDKEVLYGMVKKNEKRFKDRLV